MFFIIIYYFLQKLLPPTLAQFPPHVDLQKLGELKINDDKYNALKPTIHITQDYFQDFILRRENKEFPTDRVFIDDGGTRHFWIGFQELRNADDKRKNDVDARKGGVIPVVDLDIKKEANKTVTSNNNVIVPKTALRKKPLRKQRVKTEPNKISLYKVLRAGENKTLVRTTFFCPFFGVVTMTTFLKE